MVYQVVNLRNANEIFKSVGVEIKEHVLGYYEADVKGTVHSRDRLGALVEELMTTYFRVPEQLQSPDASIENPITKNYFQIPELQQQPKDQSLVIEPDYDEWQAASEQRHTQSGIL